MVEFRSLSVELLPAATGDGLQIEAKDPTGAVVSTHSAPIRLFRALLARLGKMGEEEGVAAFNPYEGAIRFERNGEAGPVQIDVQFRNRRGGPLFVKMSSASARRSTPVHVSSTSSSPRTASP
jgi:hypothetical protein